MNKLISSIPLITRQEWQRGTSLPQKSPAPLAKVKAGTKFFHTFSQPGTNKQAYSLLFPLLLMSIKSTDIY